MQTVIIDFSLLVILVVLNSDTSGNTHILILINQESLLRKLEDNVELEMDNWQKIVERTQRELKEVLSFMSFLVFSVTLVCICSFSWNSHNYAKNTKFSIYPEKKLQNLKFIL